MFQGPRSNEEERRVMSSDLSDCKEVWIGDLNDYIMETQATTTSRVLLRQVYL